MTRAASELWLWRSDFDSNRSNNPQAVTPQRPRIGCSGMEKLRFPEMSPSDSEDYIEDYWFTSPSASVDGSSVNSIPWADDVVNKNQEIWERIERMFYGEEPLPANDEKLRNEIQQWTAQFPHLRVSGTAMPIYSNAKAMPSDPSHDEVIAMHPFGQLERTQGVHKLTDRDRMQAKERLFRFSAKDDVHDLLANDVEKCLRITSGPLLARRIQAKPSPAIYTAVYPLHMECGAVQPAPSANRRYLDSATGSIRSVCERVGSRYAADAYDGLDDRMRSVPYSARVNNVPALKNDGGDGNEVIATKYTRFNGIQRIKTATLIPLNQAIRTSITLPSIDIEPKHIGHSSRYIGESISALIYPDTNKALHASFRNKYKRRSESE